MNQRPPLDVNVAYVEGREEADRRASNQPMTQKLEDIYLSKMELVMLDLAILKLSDSFPNESLMVIYTIFNGLRKASAAWSKNQ
ncbi:uncharacterized protein LOC131617487 isoform X2 [Vicia villosa]|uniref:uncharacterized protein LOC131617487 isoform X2 n=1 Tax=Vicia villosa TaxID=3911 RepID=UPI00273C491D|nr:uncharacterized protein LOC131617487 isoform X2 [Vicia villosa]